MKQLALPTEAEVGAVYKLGLYGPLHWKSVGGKEAYFGKLGAVHWV